MHLFLLILIIILILALLIISGLSRSLVHVLLFHYNDFKIKYKIKDDQWWNPAISWVNKNNIKWTIDLFGFRWITKIMVQFSDAFHTFNTIELASDIIREALYLALLIHAIFGLLFGAYLLIFFGSFAIILSVKILIAFNYGYDELWRDK